MCSGNNQYMLRLAQTPVINRNRAALWNEMEALERYRLRMCVIRNEAGTPSA